MTYVRALTRAGYEAVHAEDGALAWETAPAEKIPSLCDTSAPGELRKTMPGNSCWTSSPRTVL